MRHIGFSDFMHLAVREGRKTQTRRVIEPQPKVLKDLFGLINSCKYGKVGDTLWVRETFRIYVHSHDFLWIEYKDGTHVEIPEDHPHAKDAFAMAELQLDGPTHGKWRSPVTMPVWASRTKLLIKDVRVERLHEISKEDVIAEGAYEKVRLSENEHEYFTFDPSRFMWFGHYKDAFADLWSSIFGREAWEVNPYVYVIEFAKL